jgi:aromatic ring-opening dioxygenase catalytic subunit (LigB family)
MSEAKARQPVLFVPHGGGPWPFVDLGGFIPPRDVEVLRAYFTALPRNLPARPEALLVVSAHWEAPVATVMTSPRPPILYDYFGFPPEAYRIEWPAPGDPALAARVVRLLGDAGVATATDGARGFDHGAFIPFKVSWPEADVPAIQLSLVKGLDPGAHLAIGRALAPLRDEGVLILGSGMSYHHMRGYGTEAGERASRVFDAWLTEAATAAPEIRTRRLLEWAAAPSAREAHPREEHLLPLMVVAGAAEGDRGKVGFSHDFIRTRISAYHFG